MKYNCEGLNPFHSAGLFLCPLKTSENRRFFDVFRGYRKGSVTWNRLIIFIYQSYRGLLSSCNEWKLVTQMINKATLRQYHFLIFNNSLQERWKINQIARFLCFRGNHIIFDRDFIIASPVNGLHCFIIDFVRNCKLVCKYRHILFSHFRLCNFIK